MSAVKLRFRNSLNNTAGGFGTTKTDSVQSLMQRNLAANQKTALNQVNDAPALDAAGVHFDVLRGPERGPGVVALALRRSDSTRQFS